MGIEEICSIVPATGGRVLSHKRSTGPVTVFCFPGVVLPVSLVPGAVADWRTTQIDMMADLVGGRGKVGVAGLSFKPWHSDPTESPGLALAMCLNAETYDPHIECSCDSLSELFEQCDVIVMAMPFEHVENLSNLDLDGKTVIDWWGMIADGMGEWKGCKYVRFGKGLEWC